MIYNKLTVIIWCLVLISLVSCENNDFSIEQNADEYLFLENKGAILPIWVQGNTASRTFLIHVHGGPGGESQLSFNILGTAFTDPLEERYANVYYDQRASGSAQGNSEDGSISEEQFAEDLYKVIILLKDKYGSDIDVFLMGTSWGGRLTAIFLLNPVYQNEVTGWISVAGDSDVVTTANAGKDLLEYYAKAYINAGKDLSDWEKILNWAKNIDTITSEEVWGDQNSMGWDAMKLVDDSLHHETEVALNKVLKGMFFSPVNASAVLLQSSNFPEEQLDLFDDIGKALNVVKIPSLFMYGKFDFVVPPAVGLKAYENVGSEIKELVIFEHSGHLIPFNETEKFVRELVEFIEEN